MGKIGVIADKETALYFKIAGVPNSLIVASKGEAEKAYEKLKSRGDISLVIVTDQVHGWVEPKLGGAKKEIEFPLVVSVPGKRGEKPKSDLLLDLIKRTVGVEIKVQ